MKEQIAKIINDQARRYENTGYVCAGEILTLLREEIEKVEEPEIPMEKASTAVRQYIRQLYDYYQVGNLPMQPYEELVRVSGIIQADMEIAIYRGAFYAFRQKVLALLEKE